MSATIVNQLNTEYESLHTTKEDAFWTAYMGLAEDSDAARADFNQKEIALQRWLQSPERYDSTAAALKAAKADGAPEDVVLALKGWLRTFEAHCIRDPEARALAEEIIEFESKIAKARGSMKLGYTDPESGEFVEVSSIVLGTMLRTDKDPARRKAAWEGLRSIETAVLDAGFCELIKMRNKLGRLLGGDDYYDWQVKRTEGMRKSEIFDLLDQLEEKTRARGKASLEELKARLGEEAARPWNYSHMATGEVARKEDPYFPFAKSFASWVETFARLGIDYRNATMVLDLLDRKGKYENGFMHGPVPAWVKDGEFRPARIHFTANAVPGMVGSGHRATTTFFHEGGHAAHFANIAMPAPCFAQEFAPSSVALAETQSMFLDSLVGDADWRVLYSKDIDGKAMPESLIEEGIKERQPFAAMGIRGMMVVPYAERALYELPEDELTPENVLSTLRRVESQLLCTEEGSARPVLSVPHLLSGESSAYYHGYVLAEMAVHQTRAFFLERDGYLTDNPKIGPAMRDGYWKEGNIKGFLPFVESMTGKPLTPDYLAEECNQSVEQALADAKEAMEAARSRDRAAVALELNATIKVVDGHEVLADSSDGGLANAARAFERAIIQRTADASA